jgi:tRNA-splicing ligase RtcB
MPMSIKTFGPVDPRSLEQLERCMQAGDAEYGVLCADHHPGYSQPIGGGIAYEGFVSPSGVGFDIGCLAKGTRVTTSERYSAAIERVRPLDPALCWDGSRVRPARPVMGAIARGTQPTLVLRLANGRTLRATGDHEIRTKLGWRKASELEQGDRVACLPFVGLPLEPGPEVLSAPEPQQPLSRRRALDRRSLLAERGLWPLRGDEPRLPALLRLLGYVSGDGHLHRDGKSVTFYAFAPEDARSITFDVERVGFLPRIYVRQKRPDLTPEISIKVGSVALHALLAALGTPVGKKDWSVEPMPWLFELPGWLRAQYLSGFASAEMTAPLLIDGRIPNLAIKQVGCHANSAAFVSQVLTSLGFRTGINQSGPPVRDRVAHVVHVLGGESEQLRFLEEIGYCYSHRKRIAAAAAASVAWQRQAVVRARRSAVSAARAMKTEGVNHRSIKIVLNRRYGVSESFAHHGIYDTTRGAPRAPKGARVAEDHSGEIAWVEIETIGPGSDEPVYDVGTGDPAESFLAEGVVVHNCGNKAARTDLTVSDLEAQGGGVERIMSEITRRISFGLGVPARERVDHSVLDKIRNAEFRPQRKLHQLAESQLGTVGSGNHFVNLFEDEEGKVWVGVHFGSRGFGHRTASGFLALAQGLAFDAKARERGMDSPPVLFPIESELGESYIEAMNLALEYAYAGRDVVVDKVLEILGAEATHEVHNNHNEASREQHFGRTYWVVRKGCTPAQPGQEGFVGASMGDESVIVEGIAGQEAEESLFSTVHGAGRVMSRTQAAGRVRRRKRWACRDRDCARVFEARQACPDHPGAGVSKVWVEEQLKPGVVDWPGVQARLRRQGIVLVGGGADEAPEVYKRLPDVLAAHAGSIRVKHRLRPLGVAMAGRDVYDPYKD